MKEPLRVVCPHCRKAFRLSHPRFLGKRIHCLNCRTLFDAVPVPGGVSAPATPPVLDASEQPVLDAEPLSETAPVDKPVLDAVVVDGPPVRSRASPPVRTAARSGAAAPPRAKAKKGRKKKKRKRAQRKAVQFNWKLPALALGALAVLAAVFAGVMSMAGSGKVEAPTAYAPFRASDNSFQCPYPEGWDVSRTTFQLLSRAEFTSGGARIMVETDFSGSVLADIGSMGVFVGEGGAGEEPVDRIHRHGLRDVKDDYGDYREGSPVVLSTEFLDARQSEFHGVQGLFGTKLRGYRVTALSSERRVTIICHCPESEWDTLKPAFDHVISRVQPLAMR